MGNSTTPRKQRTPGEKWTDEFRGEFFARSGHMPNAKDTAYATRMFRVGGTAKSCAMAATTRCASEGLETLHRLEVGKLIRDIDELKKYDVRQLVPERLRLRRKQEEITAQLQRVACLLNLGHEPEAEPNVMPLDELPERYAVEYIVGIHYVVDTSQTPSSTVCICADEAHATSIMDALNAV